MWALLLHPIRCFTLPGPMPATVHSESSTRRFKLRPDDTANRIAVANNIRSVSISFGRSELSTGGMRPLALHALAGLGQRIHDLCARRDFAAPPLLIPQCGQRIDAGCASGRNPACRERNYRQ